MRINRFLADAGLGSRRKVEEIVRQGRVSVNGQRVVDLATQVGPQDRVEVDGQVAEVSDSVSEPRLIAFYKPKGYLTSHGDRFHEKTIFQILGGEYLTFKFAGRLDLESEGLLLLSDSGDWIQALTHPSQGLEKEYSVELDRSLAASLVRDEMVVGIRDQGETLRALRVEPNRGQSSRFQVVLVEGKKRHIRRMFAKLGAKVTRLVRVRIGRLRLADLGLQEGQWRDVRMQDVF